MWKTEQKEGGGDSRTEQQKKTGSPSSFANKQKVVFKD